MPLSRNFFGKPTQDYEGFKPHIYKDSLGYDTIGFGHKLTKKDKRTGRFNNLHFKNDTEAKLYFKNIFDEEKAGTTQQFYKNYPSLQKAPESARVAFEDMAYNIGPQFLDKFPNAKKAALNGDYETVGYEMVQGGKPNSFSAYAKQVGQRAFDNADRLIVAAGKGRHYGDGYYEITRGKLPATALNQSGLGLRDTATSVAANMQAQSLQKMQQLNNRENQAMGQDLIANNAPEATPVSPKVYAQNGLGGKGLGGFKWIHNRKKVGV